MRKDVPGAGEDEVDSRYHNLSSSNKEIPDSLLQTDSAALKQNESSVIGSRLFWENVISLLWIPID